MPWPVCSTMTLLTSHLWLHRYLLPNNDVTQVRISDAPDVSPGLGVTGPLQINSHSELSFTICCFCATYWSDTKLCTDKQKRHLVSAQDWSLAFAGMRLQTLSSVQNLKHEIPMHLKYIYSKGHTLLNLVL